MKVNRKELCNDLTPGETQVTDPIATGQTDPIATGRVRPVSGRKHTGTKALPRPDESWREPQQKRGRETE